MYLHLVQWGSVLCDGKGRADLILGLDCLYEQFLGDSCQKSIRSCPFRIGMAESTFG